MSDQDQAASSDRSGLNEVSLAATAKKGNDAARIKQIQDLLKNSLSNTSPLDANLGAVNAGLMLIEYRLKQALDSALTSGPRSLEEFAPLMPVIKDYLRITKQIGQFSQLTVRLAALHEAAEANRHNDRLGGQSEENAS
jgi:hypothetical protein